jgi:6-phosphofructokinase 1
MMKRLAILTGGGDAPGLNAVIRAAVKTAYVHDCEILGVRDGFDGFLEEKGVYPLSMDDVRGILPRGGTILGAANRGNPFARKVTHNGKTEIIDVSQQTIEAIHDLKLDALLVVGGDGTLRIARELYDLGVPTIGVPKTIDNDIGGTDYSFGFDTAVNVATDAIDRLHTTAESHHRVMVVELMGRNSGFIALYAGLAGGADAILIPEIPFHPDSVCRKVMERVNRGTLFSIVAVAEGARPEGKKQVFSIAGDEVYTARLGGIGYEVGNYIQHCTEIETRVIVLGHLQRGGRPSAFDRWLATRFGAAAVRLALDGGFGRMVALKSGKIKDITLAEALQAPKQIDLSSDTLLTARDLGIVFGDEQ